MGIESERLERDECGDCVMMRRRQDDVREREIWLLLLLLPEV